MADVILRIINEGVTEATQGVSSVGKAYDDLSKKTKTASDEQTKVFKDSADGAQKFNKILADSKPTVNITKQRSEVQKLKQEIKDYTSAALKAGVGTKEFAAAIAEAGKRKADLKDLQTTLNQLDPDKKGQAFLQLSQTIISGFAAGQGALSAFGVTTEDATKTLVKLQSALALGQFLGQIGELSDTFSNLKVAIQTSETAQKAFNLVAKANPYVLIGTAIAAAAVAVYEFSGSTVDATAKLEELDKALQQIGKSLGNNLLEQFGRQSDAIQNNITDVKDLIEQTAALATGDADQAKKKAETLEALNSKLSELQASQIKAGIDGEKQKQEGEIKAAEEGGKTKLEILKQSLIDQQNELRRQVGTGEAKSFAEGTKVLFEESQIRNDILVKNISEVDKLLTKANEEELKKEKEKNKKLSEEGQKSQDAKNKKLRDGIDSLNKQAIAEEEATNKINSDKIKQDQDLADKELEQDNRNGEILDQAKIDRQIALGKLLEDLEKEFVNTTFENNLKALEDRKQQILDNEEIVGEEKFKIIEGVEKKITELKQAQLTIQLQGLSQQFANIAALEQAFGADTKAGATAQALISTFLSAQKSFEFGTGIGGPILGAIFASIATAAGLANVAKINNVEFYKGGYTGDGDKYEAAGTVHKGEYVVDKEKTRKNRSILDAIQYDDYSKITPLDLSALLKGTGVTMNREVPETILKSYNNYDQKQVIIKNESDKTLKEINTNLKKYFEGQEGKEQRVDTKDGYIIKKGNVTRVIRRKKP